MIKLEPFFHHYFLARRKRHGAGRAPFMQAFLGAVMHAYIANGIPHRYPMKLHGWLWRLTHD